jgi:hypothetical protein
MRSGTVRLLITALFCLGLGGCVTTITGPAGPPQPAREKLGRFDAYELTPATIAPAYASSSANQKAKRKIDEELSGKMRMVFNNLQVVEPGAPAKAEEKTLRIEPAIKEIKFIGGMARFWVGPMAGSSAVYMQVLYRDMSTGEIIAQPEFYQKGGAWGGSWTIGATDNLMLSRIADDICNYASLNR